MDAVSIICVSDTHGLHRQIAIPSGDILVHAGDFTGPDKSIDALRDFDAWLGELPHRHKIVVPGNHDSLVGEHPFPHSLLHNATLLIDEEITVLGLRIWGSPVTPLYSGAFGLSAAADRRKVFANIPAGIDLLITHGPPYGVLDFAPGGMHLGCSELLAAVQRARPRLHVFGHLHGAHSACSGPPTTFINAAVLGANDVLMHALIVVEYHKFH